VIEFAIDADGAAVGACGVHLLDDVNARTVELGYWLGVGYWGRSIATATTRGATAHVFATLRELARVEAWVFAWNPASARVLEKAGFTLEGRLRARVHKDGVTIDQLAYVRLTNELRDEPR